MDDDARDKTELIEKMSKALEESVPGATFSFSQPIELRVAELISGVRSDVAIKTLRRRPRQSERERPTRSCASCRPFSGAEDVKAEATSGLPQLQIKPDRAAIARYGLNVEDVNDLVESVVAGKEAGQVYRRRAAFQSRRPAQRRGGDATSRRSRSSAV